MKVLDAANLKNDLLEIIYFILQKKNLGDFDSDLTISESELEMIDVISKDVRHRNIDSFLAIYSKGT